MTTTATFIRKLHDWESDARLFRLSEPMRVGWAPFDEPEPDERPLTHFVIVSAMTAYSGPEVLTFAADSGGNVLSWADGPGSQRGTLSHKAAIRDAGWELVLA